MSKIRINGAELPTRRFHLLAGMIVAFALGLRILYVTMTATPYPIRGDVNQYVLYAWNLAHRSSFSSALPNSPAAVPDSYRGPGYPVFLAAAMLATDNADLPVHEGPEGRSVLGYDTDRWMRLALTVQVVISAATVGLAIALARLWLSRRWALAAGLLVAIWPHLISFSGILLSETLLGFSLLLSFCCLCWAEQRDDRVRMGIAGLCWGATYLVNPIIAIFPVLAASVLARRSKKLLAVLLTAGFLIAPGLWALRNSTISSGSSALQRVEENFVQGSWPQFHRAYNSRFENAISQQIVSAIDEEVGSLRANPRPALEGIFARMALDPIYYLSWYLFEKPYLLWDWGIRIGAGDIYFLPVQHSPFERIPLLKISKRAFELLNPLVFALAAMAALAGSFAAVFRRTTINFAPMLLSLLCVYLTSVHTALQAEPRYSIPYRPEELLLAVTTLAWLWKRARLRWPAKHGASNQPLSPAQRGELQSQA